MTLIRDPALRLVLARLVSPPPEKKLLAPHCGLWLRQLTWPNGVLAKMKEVSDSHTAFRELLGFGEKGLTVQFHT